MPAFLIYNVIEVKLILLQASILIKKNYEQIF